MQLHRWTPLEDAEVTLCTDKVDEITQNRHEAKEVIEQNGVTKDKFRSVHIKKEIMLSKHKNRSITIQIWPKISNSVKDSLDLSLMSDLLKKNKLIT